MRLHQTAIIISSLYWLPVQQRIQYKIVVNRHKALLVCWLPFRWTSTKSYNAKWRRGLCSPLILRVSVRWTRTETAKPVFCVAAPNVWNSLPNNTFNVSSLSAFHDKLKTVFYCCILVMNIPTSTPLYWLLADIMCTIQIFFTLRNISRAYGIRGPWRADIVISTWLTDDRYPDKCYTGTWLSTD